MNKEKKTKIIYDTITKIFTFFKKSVQYLNQRNNNITGQTAARWR